MDKKTSKLAVTSLIVFIVSIIGIVIALLIYRGGFRGGLDVPEGLGRFLEIVGFLLPIVAFPAFFASIGLAIISLFLILFKRHQLKGLVLPLIVLILSALFLFSPPFNQLW